MNLLPDSFFVNQILKQSLQTTHSFLLAFATTEDFTTKMTIAFGDCFDAEVAKGLATDWARGDFTAFPEIAIRSAVEINGAIFTGTNGNDTLPPSGTGNGGDDTFNPLRGYDTVDGGNGTDLLVVDYSANTYAGSPYTPPGIRSSVSWNETGGFNGSFSAYKLKVAPIFNNFSLVRHNLQRY